ncbi:cytochrome P450 4d8-like [Musca autumnalis]|uniref:cytochrome P450 4d8-like n=1 Tax=Musca autumnalis TaxID=221902 RepID=UPI003CE78D4A
MRKAVTNLGGPYNIPLLGALQWAYGITPKSIFQKSQELRKKYGKLFKFWIFNRLAIVSADAELNEQILTSGTHITKNRLYEVLHDWLGAGLLTSDGQKWHSRRRIITPAFHFKILEDFLDVFKQQSEILVDCLASKADGKTAIDVYSFVCGASLDIIAETAMGTNVKAQTGGTKQYTKAVKEMTNMLGWRFLQVHLHNEIIFSILQPIKKFKTKRYLCIMHEFTHNVIKTRRNALETSMKDSILSTNGKEEYNDLGTKKRMALLDVLLQSSIDGQPLTNEDIREEVDTFMFEGHDTTATALSCTLYLLARHPRVQRKLLQEIEDVLGKANNPKPMTLMNLNDLKYMECVIKESMRLLPPIPFIAREIKEDFKYKHSSRGEGTLPAGSELIIGIYMMGSDSDYYEHHTEFLPERFQQPLRWNNFQYTPFSAGPRNCIGQKFAMYEMKVVLTHIIRSYELLPFGENIEPLLGIVLRSSNGMQLGLKKRAS